MTSSRVRGLPRGTRYAYRERVMRSLAYGFLGCFFLTISAALAGGNDRTAVVSVPDQKIAVLENGTPIAEFKVSTSRYGLGDRFGSYATPVGELQVAAKLGEGAPVGAVFRNRRMTGEILRPNASGRDPIVTRILWLRGLQSCNANAFSRNIYIHGTPVERLIGRPASYGCIRMRSRDIVQLFEMMPLGCKVEVMNVGLHRAMVTRSINSMHGSLAGSANPEGRPAGVTHS